MPDTLPDPLQASVDHLVRMVVKRGKLTAAIEEAGWALVEQVGRTDLTWTEKAAVYDLARQFSVPHLSAAMLRVMGTHAPMLRAVKEGAVIGDALAGPLPLGVHPTPGRGQECVYLLLDANRHCLYVGVSSDVRARLKTHWATRDKKPGIASWEAIPQPSREAALQVESDLIVQHRPTYNRAGLNRRRRGRAA